MSRAGPLRRGAALGLDGLAALLLAVPFARTAGYAFAERAVVTLRIGSPDTWWRGPIPLVLSTVGELTFFLPFVLFLLLTVTEGLAGRSPGKRALGLEIRRRDGSAIDRRHRWRRLLLKTAPCWGATVALLAGSWHLLLAAGVAGLALLAGCLAVLGPRRLALHDRWSGTAVVRSAARRLGPGSPDGSSTAARNDSFPRLS